MTIMQGIPSSDISEDGSEKDVYQHPFPMQAPRTVTQKFNVLPA